MRYLIQKSEGTPIVVINAVEPLEDFLASMHNPELFEIVEGELPEIYMKLIYQNPNEVIPE